MLAVGSVERADQGEGGQIDANGSKPGAANGREQPFDHVALGGDEHDLLTRTAGGIDDAERMEVEHGVRQRHGHLVLRLEAHGRRELLAVAQRRQLERPHHGALIGDPDPYTLAHAAAREELAQGLGDDGLIHHVALANRVGG